MLAALALAAVLVLFFLAFRPWQSDDAPVVVWRYDSNVPPIMIDFANRTTEKSLNVTLDFTIENLSKVESAQGFVNLNITIAETYPGSAGGTIGCWTNITLNGDRWYATHHASNFEPTPVGQWGLDRNETSLQYANLTYPTYIDETHLESLLRAGPNVLRATADCYSRISSTGPGTAIVTLSPLRAVIVAD